MSQVAEVFRTMPERFRKDAAAGIDAVIGYHVEGEGGGRWRVTIKGGTVGVAPVEGDLGPCSLEVRADAATFLGINLGTIDATEAFSAGKLRLSGELALAPLLPRLFQKYAPPKAPAVTVRAILESLPARFRSDKAGELRARIGYDVTGAGGAQVTAVIDGARCTISEGLASRDVTQHAAAADFVAMVLGTLDPMAAFSSGRLRVSGNMELATVIPRLFARYAPPGTAAAETPEELIVLKRNISVPMRYATGPVMGRFLEALKQKRILANVCPRCGRKQVPPREVCAPCRCRVTDFVEVGPEGTLVYLEVVYYASPDPLTGKTRETPYGDVRVLLDGCAGRETFWHLLKKEDLGTAERGDRVRPVWSDTRTGSIEDILYFEKVTATESRPAPASRPVEPASSDPRAFCSLKDGLLALPYQYFAGRTGSRFLIALRDARQIRGVRCDRCAITYVPPRQTCDRCFADLTRSWVDLPSTGTVEGFTVIRYEGQHLPRKPPYILALVKIDGADTPIAHIVDGVAPEQVREGMRVTAVFAETPTSTILDISHFAPL
ncbi:MAG: SCP2 sterol-binding domain-containing protein [Acidobacteriota bacterium]